MGMLIQDIRYGLRLLRKSPGFAAIAVLTLALAIGANTLVLSLLNTFFLRTAPVRNPEELVTSTSPHREVSLPEYAYYRDHNAHFSGLAAEYATAHVYLENGGESQILLSAIVSDNYFDLLGVRPFLGRFFAADQHASAANEGTVVLSYAFWQSHFGGDPDIVGKTLVLNSTTQTIIGVAPQKFHRLYSGFDDDLWLPPSAAAVVVAGCKPQDYNCGFSDLIGRLKPGSGMDAAQAELNTLSGQWESIYPTLKKTTFTLHAARGIDPRSRKQISQLPPLLLAGVVVLLLIACANLSGLLLVRGAARSREVAVRLALGAARGRIIRQMLTESALIAIAGSLCGTLLLQFSGTWLSSFPFVHTEGFRSYYNVGMDKTIWLATLAVSVLTTLIFGLYPAFQSSFAFPLEALKQAGLTASPRSRVRSTLVAFQLALVVVLSAGAVLVVRSLDHVLAGPGFDAGHVAIVRVSPYRLGYSQQKSASLQTEALRRLASLPGVELVSFGQLMPWWESWEDWVALPGQESAKQETRSYVHYNTMAPGYLRTLSIPLLRGREFTELDRKGAPAVVVVNQSLAEKMWPAQNAIGRTLLIGGTECTVVGVAADAQYIAAADGVHPFFYLPYWQVQNNGDSRFLVRTSSDPGAMLSKIKETINNIDPAVPVGEDSTMVQALMSDFGPLRITRAILLSAAAVALFLMAIGLYSILAFAVTLRTREVGIRMALGATLNGVLTMFVREGLKLALVGALAGVGLAFISLRLLSALLYGVGPFDPAVLAGVLGLVLAVSAAASLIPARRATRVDPMVALRQE